MSRLTSLKSAKTRDDVAALLQTTKKGLASILFSQPIASRYTTFEIPKKKGGKRTIKVPDDKLKLLQEKLSVLLQDCLDEIEASQGSRKRVAHGFKRGCSILSNARQHRNRRWVFNLDLRDFFPSINFGRVRGFFLKDRNFALQPDVATVLAKIACDGNALPQGSPCSPVISNLIAHVLDMHIVRLAIQTGCTYTRYADDLTFSTNKGEFPLEIAYKSETQPAKWVPGKKLQELIKHSGFIVNDTKTRMQFRRSRQEVTGLIVNQKVNVPSEYRHNVRAMVHRLFRTGSFQLLGAVKANGDSLLQMREGKLDELHGRLGFIDGIDLYNKAIAATRHEPTHMATKESMYRQFLIYRDFYNAPKPVILCEGKTDNVYIKHAIRSLATQFPALADVDAKGKITLKVRLYKYTKTSTGRILGLKDGGSSPLGNFITSYKKDTGKFAAPGLINPFIILFDNDSGRKSICNPGKAARASNKAISPTDPYTHIVKNLYLVPTPLAVGRDESKIEDFFDAGTKGKVIAGKSFSTDNDYDRAKFYGKADFAEQVVTPNAKTIDFTGFVPMLQSLVTVIAEHAKTVAAQSGTP
ncbi:MAG: retron Ec67 family RNA-directed DNA polymerase/endonuclease [Acidobacteriaceae bacterium]